MTDDGPRVAVLRPDDGRLAGTAAHLASLGARPVRDPMLAVEPTGATPEPAAFVVLTSTTGVDLAADAGWSPGDATVCCIGASTAEAARAAGWTVDVVPEEYSSAGLVAALADAVDGERVEVARSNHGSPVLIDGLRDAGAGVHETVLYELVRPDGAGSSAALAAAGDLDGALFTSSLMVDNWVAAAADRGVREAALAGLGEATVGAIGSPTRGRLAEYGVRDVVVPDVADVEALAEAVVAASGR